MSVIHIGCAGWAYRDWNEAFYPKGTSSRDQLKFYAKYFDTVEVNSTFYNPPNESTVRRWRRETDESFSFTIKIWREITHQRGQKARLDFEDRMTYFFTQLKPLEDKIPCYLMQFPLGFEPSEVNRSYLTKILDLAEDLTQKRIFIEFRDNSWFNQSIAPLYDRDNTAFVTVYLDDIIPQYYENQDSYYIRLIGDREITKFNSVQRDMQDSWADMTYFLKSLRENEEITDIFVIFNNHYTGFAPADSNRLKKELHMPFKSFNKQSNITDFM